MKTYEEIIQRFARIASDRYFQGSWDTMPDGMDIVAWIFDKESAEVKQDVETRRDVLIKAQVQKHRQTA